MEHSTKIGTGFGITSGIITTLGMMVGLYSGTHLKIAVIGAIITVAFADSFSDALGIHVSEETVQKSHKKVWKSTFSTLLSKFLTAIIFIIPLLFLNLEKAIITNIILGITLLGIFSYFLAKSKNKKPFGTILEHISIAIIVIIITYFVGKGVEILFG